RLLPGDAHRSFISALTSGDFDPHCTAPESVELSCLQFERGVRGWEIAVDQNPFTSLEGSQSSMRFLPDFKRSSHLESLPRVDENKAGLGLRFQIDLSTLLANPDPNTVSETLLPGQISDADTCVGYLYRLWWSVKQWSQLLPPLREEDALGAGDVLPSMNCDEGQISDADTCVISAIRNLGPIGSKLESTASGTTVPVPPLDSMEQETENETNLFLIDTRSFIRQEINRSKCIDVMINFRGRKPSSTRWPRDCEVYSELIGPFSSFL
ncbi:hypothetical protein BaRGS_00014036, partial [Batillaria attramentaria]